MLLSLNTNAQSFSDYKDYVLKNEILPKTNKVCRANDLNVGLIVDNKFIWDTLKQPVHFNIYMGDSILVINSARTQIYKRLSVLLKTDDLIKWYCLDEENKNCVLWIYTYKQYNNNVTILSEYEDVAWFYDCGPMYKR